MIYGEQQYLAVSVGAVRAKPNSFFCSNNEADIRIMRISTFSTDRNKAAS